jgi:HEAT repeat protein
VTYGKKEIQRSLELLNDPDVEVQLRAIRNLGAIGNASTVAKFLEILNYPTSNLRPLDYMINTEVIFNLQFLMMEFPDRNAEDKLIEILTDESEPNHGYRALCAEVLGRLKSERAFPILIQLLHSSPPEFQETIAFVLH